MRNHPNRRAHTFCKEVLQSKELMIYVSSKLRYIYIFKALNLQMQTKKLRMILEVLLLLWLTGLLAYSSKSAFDLAQAKTNCIPITNT